MPLNIGDGWEKVNDNMLQKTWKFSNFREALDFVNKAGEIAEQLQHHPDMCIKNYNQVVISITTHDAGNVLTEKDYTLAQKLEHLK